MATSCIFHNVIIDEFEKAEQFVSAIEASVADPYKADSSIEAELSPSMEEIRRIQELRRGGDRVVK